MDDIRPMSHYTSAGRHTTPARRAIMPDDVTLLGIAVLVFWLLLADAWIGRGGAGQLLWLCDLATLGTAIGLLVRSPLILTAQFTGMLVYHFGWQADFLAYCTTGWMPLHATAYMFGTDVTKYEKGLSFFQHTFLVPFCLWGLIRVGASRRGWQFQSVQTFIGLVLTWALTAPADNVNWLFGAGFSEYSPAVTPPALYYFLLVLVPPLVIYAPSNVLLTWMARRWPVRHPTNAPPGAIVAVLLIAAGVSVAVARACEPELRMPLPVGDDLTVTDRISIDQSLHLDSIAFGLPGHLQRVPLVKWEGPLPVSRDGEGRPRALLLRQLLGTIPIDSIPRASQQVILEGRRNRLGTVVCAVIGAVAFHPQPACDGETALRRFRVHAQLGEFGLAEFAWPDHRARPLADNQVNTGSPSQSLFVVTVVAFDGQRITRTPFFVVRRAGVWRPDDVIWFLRGGFWTATLGAP
jgi:hypothetical protein